MDAADLPGVLAFLRSAGNLKDTLRTAWTAGGRRESTAEHTWRLCLMALALHGGSPGIDFAKLVSICIVHDLGEAIRGDVPATAQVSGPPKGVQEREDLLQLLEPLPPTIRADIVGLWDEYEAAATPESKLAKALDKLETILQHNQGANPAGFDYSFNLDYGKRYTTDPPLIAAIRELLDAETRQKASGPA